MPVDWENWSTVEEPKSDAIDWDQWTLHSPPEEPKTKPIPPEILNGGGYRISRVGISPTQAPNPSRIDLGTLINGPVMPPELEMNPMAPGQSNAPIPMQGLESRKNPSEFQPPEFVSPTKFALPQTTAMAPGQEGAPTGPDVLPTPEEQRKAEGFGYEPDDPIIALGDLLIKEKGAATGVEEGINESLRNTLNGLVTPRNIAYMLASMGVATTGQVASRLVSAFWAAFMGANQVKNLPEKMRQLGDEMGKPEDQRDKAKIANILTDTGIETAFTTLPAIHAASPIKPEFPPSNFTISGRSLQTPEGAKPIPKGVENAIPERSATEIPVQVPPASGEAVGTRISGAEEPAVSQVPVEQANPPVEATPENAGTLANEAISKFSDSTLNFTENMPTTEQSWDAGMQAKTVADLEALAALRDKIAADKNKFAKLRIQVPGEAIMAATNIGGAVEGKGAKLGPRPLDWKNNPEVQDWLRKNHERAGVTLPEDFPAETPKPVEAPKPAEGGGIGKGLRDALEKNKNNEGGFVNLDGAIEFGRNVFEKVKDFAAWGTKLVRRAGEWIKPHLQELWQYVRNEHPEQIAKDTGLEFKKNDGPAVSMGGLTPDQQAQFRSQFKPQWEFTDRRPDSPTAGMTFYTPENASRAEVIQRMREKVAEWTGKPTGEITQRHSGIPIPIKELVDKLGGKVTGIAERIRARREAAGMTEPTVPGQGLNPKESVQKGRARIAAGENPESAMTEFEQTQRLNSGDIELARAHAENLARETNKSETQFGRTSEQFKNAYKTESDWASRTKAMQTESHRLFAAQQGEVDIDTGSFAGMSRFKEQVSDKPFTPEQATVAEKKAKTVKDATDKADVTQQVLLDHIEKKATAGNAEKRAKDAADKTVRENAVRVSDAENAHRTAQQTRDNAIAKIESDAEKRAGDAASKTVRENAIRVAKEENAARIKQMQRDVDVAAMAEKRAKDALDSANKRARDVAARAAREEQRKLSDPLAAIWEKAKGYIEQGMDNFDDIRAKLATDLGMPIDRVTRMLAQDKRAKFLTDEAWRAQERARMVKQQAKAWVRSLDIPGYIKAIKMVPKLAFTVKVMGHGPVALGTHAPMLAFQPPFWKMYLQNYAKMYRMVGKPTPKGQANAKAFYESKVQDLLHDPNYTIAQRAGLINDPMHFEDYNSPEMMAWMGKLTAMGNRGYSVLKMIRQDLFNHHWQRLPKTMQTMGVAEAIADSVNHSTGVVSTTPIQGSHLAFFAPRLEMSRVAWLAADPAKALGTVPRWKNATDAQKWAAIQQAKEKAWVVGTMASLLALNQAILSATDSKQEINWTDPLKSDFWKFKIAGMKASYGNAMLSMARLPARLWDAREGSGARLKNREYPDESVYKLAGEYARSQASPAASIAADLFLKSDFQHRPLPNSDQEVPRRLRDQGVKPYTWPEFLAERLAPIPIEEGIKEVWKNGLGMNEEQMKRTRMALASIAFMGATGGNLTEDYPAQLRDLIKPDSKASDQEIVDAFKKLVINEPTPEKKQKRINQILSENNPFTADGEPKAFMTTSKEKEEKFVEKLSPAKLKEYKDALLERAKSYQRLQDALNSAK